MKTFILLSIVLLSINSVLLSQQWTQTATPDGGGITDMVVLNDGTILATTSSFNWPNGQQGGVRRSTNGGASWQNILNAFNGRTLHLGSSGKVYASYWPYPSSEVMIYSTDGGLNWLPSGYSAGNNNNVFSIITKNNDSMVFVGTRNGVWTQQGSFWVSVSNGIPANTFVYDLDVSYNGNHIAAGTSKGLYVSTNNGANWTAVSGISQTDTIYTVKFAHYTTDSPGDRLYAGESDGTVYEADLGNPVILGVVLIILIGSVQNIEAAETGTSTVLAVASTRLGADNMIDNGFAYSTDRGANWTQYNNGLPSSPNMSSLTYQMQGNNINYYAGMFENTNGGAKVYKMSSPIGIQQISSKIPNHFSLSQNYPNPFNPMTKIKFNVTKASNVNITVFDVLGRHITTLVNEKLGAGIYETEWNANNMPGGVYFYRIETEDFSETKKMVLVK